MNIGDALGSVTEHWSPRVVAAVNNHYVKVAKLRGQLAWHKHDNQDEMFIVVAGRLTIELENGSVQLGPGDFYVVPRNTMHNPVAEEECHIMLIEPIETLHTGDVQTPLTKTIQQQLETPP